MLRVLLLLSLVLNSVLCANILYIGDVASPSHYIWNKAFAMGLVAKGHNVTLVSPDQDKIQQQNPKNFHRIVLHEMYEELHRDEEMSNYNDFAKLTPYGSILAFHDWTKTMCTFALNTSGLQHLLNYPPNFKFDLIIFDITAGNCLLPLIHRFDYPPSIAATAFMLPSYASFDFGNFLVPSIVPWYGLPYTNQMSIIERAQNLFYAYLDLYMWNKVYGELNELTRPTFGGHIPKYQEMQQHISMLIANSDPLLDYPQPVPPNIILVGGLHARPSKPLPSNLQKVMDTAVNGAIIFSLGSNIRSDRLGEDNIKTFIKVFSELKLTVLWKFESNYTNLPPNVIIQKWLPQNDLLGHPNAKLFIGHGGALSTQEALYHGVPMILVPFFVDQYINAKIIVEKRLGTKMDVQKFGYEYIKQKVSDAVNDAKYGENVKHVSKVFRDRQETPLERAVFWAEYAMRNGGAHHLNTSARRMRFYEALNMDIFGVLLVAAILVCIVGCRLLKCVARGRSRQKVKVN